MDEPEMKDESGLAMHDAPVAGHVEFEHVKFGYVPGQTVIKDFSVDVAPGQTVAIVGPTGAGKSTLVNLLMRFYEIDGGSIKLDGVDTREMSRHDLRRHFGMVLQDTWLFNGTIRDNIAYGNDAASDEDILRVSKAALADHFVRTLPDGYDTVINEEGTNISVGQRQLLTIARALLADRRMPILDEATSSIDTRTERLVQQAMGELMANRTSFVIAHRLSTIREADHDPRARQGRYRRAGYAQRACSPRAASMPTCTTRSSRSVSTRSTSSPKRSRHRHILTMVRTYNAQTLHAWALSAPQACGRASKGAAGK